MKKRNFAVWFFSIYVCLWAIIFFILFINAKIIGFILSGLTILFATWLFRPSLVALNILRRILILSCIVQFIGYLGLLSRKGFILPHLFMTVAWLVFCGAPIFYSFRKKIREQFK